MNYLGKPNALSITVKSNTLTLFLSSFVYKRPTCANSEKSEICPYAKIIEKVLYICHTYYLYHIICNIIIHTIYNE